MSGLMRRMARRETGACAVLAASMAFAAAMYPIPLRAHHSIAGIYDSSQPVTIDGVVARFHFVNPHPFVVVSVKDARGATQDWRLEMDNRFELEAIGMTAKTLMPGDRIVATGSRARSKDAGLYVRRLDRPADGFWYEQVGSTPRIR